MAMRYSDSRPSSSTSITSFQEESDDNASEILNRISLNSDKVAQQENNDVFEEKDNLREDITNDGRVIFARSDTDEDNVALTDTLETESNSGSDEDDFDDAEIGEVFEEIRQTYGEDLSDLLTSYSKNVSKEYDIHDIEESIDHIPVQRTATEEDKSCATCCKPRLAENVTSLEEGQHIRLPGYYMTFRFRKKLIPMYHHHAIIKEVKRTFENSIELVVIHFSKVNKEIAITEETNTYNLEHDEIYIIDYERPKYDPETIIHRAESMVPKASRTDEKNKFGSYNPFVCNCEHFASWCVVGEGESFQAQSVLKSSAKVFSKVASTASKIWRFVKRILSSASHKLTTGFNLGKYLPVMFLGATSIVYLIYTVATTISKRIQYARGKLCKVCFKREVISLWASFGSFFVTSGISYIIVHFLVPLLGPTPVGIPLLLVLVLLSLFLQWGMGKLVKALMSPYACDKIEIKHLSQVKPGSMISFNYFRIPHFAIVTGKDVENEESNIGTITCVHYGLRGLNVFGTREVIEEAFELNVKDNTKNVKLVDCRQLKTFPADVAVSRARARLGETTWRPFSNRSDHLCFDTLVQEGTPQGKRNTQSRMIRKAKSKLKSSYFIGRKEIHLKSDLQLGHIVKYKDHTGILVHLEDIARGGEQNFKMELVVYWDLWIVRKRFYVNLKKERMCIMKYNPAHCVSLDERVQRACGIAGELCAFRAETDFLESCILKK